MFIFGYPQKYSNLIIFEKYVYLSYTCEKKLGLNQNKSHDEVNNSVYGTLTWLLFTVFTISNGRSEWWPDHSPPHS